MPPPSTAPHLPPHLVRHILSFLGGWNAYRYTRNRLTGLHTALRVFESDWWDTQRTAAAWAAWRRRHPDVALPRRSVRDLLDRQTMPPRVRDAFDRDTRVRAWLEWVVHGHRLGGPTDTHVRSPPDAATAAEWPHEACIRMRCCEANVDAIRRQAETLRREVWGC